MRAVIAAVVMGLAALPAVMTTARPVTYTLPADTVPALLAQPDTEIVVSNCSACHSLDYIATQPRRKGPQFWRDAVTKMINVYKAPIDPADADAVAAALTRKFG
jgi:mono/diheme cytochrome c family protein